MAIPKIKATYSLDEPTVRRLEEIARKWETSKSDALSRLINQGASDEEDAEVNAMLAATTTEGADRLRMYGLPGDRVISALRKYGRLP